MENKDRIKALQKFFNDPEWYLVEDMLSKNTESLKDVSTIDLSQSAETIKAIVAGRQETLKLVEDFKHEVAQTKIINSKQTTFQ